MALLSTFLPFIAGENEGDGPGVGVGVDPVADVKHTLAQLDREAATISRTNEFEEKIESEVLEQNFVGFFFVSSRLPPTKN